ncbi:hypothetical protein K1719_000938 [Acacia pycnantha]|nr:hypothetical protein K1719_000938 [Acacia pycnantha]
MASPPPSPSPSPSSKVSLKLLIDTKGKRVLLAEASKEFIDFLFNMLRLPVGTVTRLLTKKGMVGCLGKLYESIENLSDNYFNNQTQDKNILLKPSAPFASGYLLLANDDNINSSGTSNLHMSPSRHCTNVVTRGGHEALKLGNDRNATQVKDASGGEGGFVKGVVTYTVMDDLEVCPMSTISTVALISKFNIRWRIPV